MKSSPRKFLCKRPCNQEIGLNGSLATTQPSNNELNIPIKAVAVKPIDFILTIDKSRL